NKFRRLVLDVAYLRESIRGPHSWYWPTNCGKGQRFSWGASTVPRPRNHPLFLSVPMGGLGRGGIASGEVLFCWFPVHWLYVPYLFPFFPRIRRCPQAPGSC
ncbi:unnamed protein product, partial [Discosporangium mesarthrocarpum]